LQLNRYKSDKNIIKCCGHLKNIPKNFCTIVTALLCALIYGATAAQITTGSIF